jgi:hypothetical protein
MTIHPRLPYIFVKGKNNYTTFYAQCNSIILLTSRKIITKPVRSKEPKKRRESPPPPALKGQVILGGVGSLINQLD